MWFILLDMIETKQPELYSSPGTKQRKKQEISTRVEIKLLTYLLSEAHVYLTWLIMINGSIHYRELNKSLNEITSSEIIPSNICLCLYK